MTEQEAYVAFNLTEQIGSVGVGDWVDRWGSVRAAWEAFPAKTARVGGEVDWRREFALAKRYGVTILTPCDAGYPALLKATRGHPLVLYVKGSVEALSRDALALVGTRRATTYGRDQANRMAQDLAAAGWCIISGLAVGIDAEAHRGALAAGGMTVGVLGSALDEFYPAENRELAREIVQAGGAVVSEFPFGRKPDTQTFPQRNRVVAALSRGVIALEAPLKSGTLLTTRLAAEMGRTVMALPARVDNCMSAGCLALLRDGARLVRNAADVEEEMRPLVPSPAADKLVAKRESAAVLEAKREERVKTVGLSAAFTVEEALVMREIDQAGISLDRLVEKTGLPAAKISSLCMALRLKGRLRFLPGNRVALPRGD